MTIVFYEPLCKGIEHNKFIASTIRMVQSIYSNSEFILIAEAELCKNLKTLVNFSRIINIIPPSYENSRYKNIKENLSFERKNAKTIKGLHCDKLICLSASMYTVYVLNKQLKNIKISIFFHGILESLAHKYKFYNMLFWVKYVLTHEGKNIDNIVLGDKIRERILKILPQLKNKLYSVDIVYDYNVCNKVINKQLCFGSIGFGQKEKNSDFIFELAKKYEGQASFSHIGKMDETLIPDTTTVNILGRYTPLNNEEFDKALKKIDYALYFYPKNMYQFTASGAIFDALTNGKPVICLRTAYFEYIFEKLGDVGYLCDSKEEMNVIIQEIIEKHDEQKYRSQQKNIVDNIWKFSEHEIQKQLKDILEK